MCYNLIHIGNAQQKTPKILQKNMILNHYSIEDFSNQSWIVTIANRPYFILLLTQLRDEIMVLVYKNWLW